MTVSWHGSPIADRLSDNPTVNDVTGILTFLEEQGTFRFPTVSSGLFSAAAAENPEFRLTGYQNVWARDNCHIAHALWKVGRKDLAVPAVEALLTFYIKHRHRFIDVIEGRADPTDPMNRPHIRFDGETLTEILDVRWAHAQNDALGYVLWLAVKLLRAGNLEPTSERIDLLRLMVEYFAAIKFWEDEESGHWEETRKIEASSIGTVVAGLDELRAWLADRSHASPLPPPASGLQPLLNGLIERGQTTLAEILPAECIQPDPKQHRLHDAALLFLIEPLQVVDEAMAARIVRDVREHLTGPIGIRRYNGDSYWCANYRDLLSAEVRTTDFSEDMTARDKLLKAGEEAQWCIFDPILSVIHGQRYWELGSEEAFSQQVHHLRRALAQLTTAESRFPEYRCPESYFLEHGSWIPNDITPLLWTQANLLWSLEQMKKTVAQRSVNTENGGRRRPADDRY